MWPPSFVTTMGTMWTNSYFRTIVCTHHRDPGKVTLLFPLCFLQPLGP